MLLDEVEKAHPDVMELFFQVFDKGSLEDGEGREIDFKNTVILLTSNVGTDLVMKLCADPDTKPEPAALAEALRPELLKVFPAALLGRMILVPYYPIGDDVMKQIITLQLGRIGQRLKQNHKAQFSYSDDLVANIASRCKEVESGARNVGPHPHALAPARDVGGVPRPHGGGREHLARARVGRCQGGVPVRDFLTWEVPARRPAERGAGDFMTTPSVHWYEGMFLRPHHFMTAQRHWFHQAGLSERFDLHYNWGLRSVAIDLDALARTRDS